jgi:hypothetical protein
VALVLHKAADETRIVSNTIKTKHKVKFPLGLSMYYTMEACKGLGVLSLDNRFTLHLNNIAVLIPATMAGLYTALPVVVIMILLILFHVCILVKHSSFHETVGFYFTT